MCEYLPLGSVIRFKGSAQKFLIIARALRIKNGDKEFFFDYGVVPYPDGLTGDQMAFVQHNAISDVVFRGFTDSDDQNVVGNINRYLEEHPDILYGSVETWNS